MSFKIRQSSTWGPTVGTGIPKGIGAKVAGFVKPALLKQPTLPTVVDHAKPMRGALFNLLQGRPLGSKLARPLPQKPVKFAPPEDTVAQDFPFSIGYELELYHAGLAYIPKEGWQPAPGEQIFANPYVNAVRDCNYVGDFAQAFRDDLKEGGVECFAKEWAKMKPNAQRILRALPPMNVIEINTRPSLLPADERKELITQWCVSKIDEHVRQSVMAAPKTKMSMRAFIQSFNGPLNKRMALQARSAADDMFLVTGPQTKACTSQGKELTYYLQVNLCMTWESFGERNPAAAVENFMAEFSRPRRKNKVHPTDLMPLSRDNAAAALDGLRASQGLKNELRKLQGYFSAVSLIAITASSQVGHNGISKNKHAFLLKNTPTDLREHTLSQRDQDLLASTSPEERDAIVAALSRDLKGKDVSNVSLTINDEHVATVERFIRSALGWQEPELADAFITQERFGVLQPQSEEALGYTKRKQPLSRPVFEDRILANFAKFTDVSAAIATAKTEAPLLNQTSKSKIYL